MAQALAIEEQVRAYGGPRFQLTKEVMNRFAEAIEKAKVDVVPRTLIGGGSGGAAADGRGGLGGGNVLEALLGLLLADKKGLDVGASPPMSADAEAMSAELRAAVAVDRGTARTRGPAGAQGA